MELNPKHPVTNQMREQWHKIAVLLMIKFKQTSVEITSEEIENLQTCGKSNICVKVDGDNIKIWLVDDTTALRLSEEK